MNEEAFHWAQSELRASQPGLSGIQVETLRAEASFRAFYRLQLANTSAVLMVSPPEREQNEQFERLATVFGAVGIPVPEVLAANRARGWFLLTDLGSRELADAYGTEAEDAGMEAALTTLIQLQTVRDEAIPPYTTERFHDELGIFSEWFVSGLLEQQPPDHFETAYQFLVERTSNQKQCCVHRDYHCRNLLYNPVDGHFGVVDFQDALMGPVSYDLASLLHDCYHTFSDPDVARWRDWYLARSPLALDPETFAADMSLMAIQRQLKAVGIFARLQLRDSKSTHLPHILPVLESLIRLTAGAPELSALADWLEKLDLSTIATRIQALQN